jgi:hypothetical protein
MSRSLHNDAMFMVKIFAEGSGERRRRAKASVPRFSMEGGDDGVLDGPETAAGGVEAFT